MLEARWQLLRPSATTQSYFSDVQTAIFYSSFRGPVPPKDTAARDGAKFLGSEPRHLARVSVDTSSKPV